MLSPAGPEAEESTLRLLYSKIYYTNALCKRSKRCTELITGLILIIYGQRKIETFQWVLMKAIKQRNQITILYQKCQCS